MTANELHVPVSDPTHPTPTFLTLLSADTDHSFWVPRLAGKTDLIPEPPELRCGSTRTRPDSTSANARNIAERSTPRCCCACTSTRARTSTGGLQAQQRPARAISTARCRGPASLRDHRLHQLPRRWRAPAANGRFGPDLTHLMSRDTIASGAVPNTPENLRLWIRRPRRAQAGIADAGDELERARN